MYKRFIAIFIISLTALLFSFQSFAKEILLYEKSTDNVVSDGVTHQNINRYTSNGWLNINVLRVDLTNPNINIDTLFCKDGSSIRETVLDMAKDSGAIAAINGDFFSPKPGTSLAHAIGPLIQSGKIITTPAEEENKNKFAVFGITKTNIPLFSYWSKNVTLTSSNGKSMNIYDINKFGWFTYLYMYDRNWGPKTIGKSEKFPNLVEMVVVDNKVKSFSIGNGPIEIPKGGYVISGDFDAGRFLKDNFKVGDTVKVNIRTTPTWKSLKMAVGGGSILVKNGKIPSSFSLPEENEVAPCTSLGITKNNKEAILVTVDGRQIMSKGLNTYNMAELMVELGAYNAIQFDGGGSTTFVSRDSFHNDVQVINSYSDPTQRAVANGIGVFTNAPKGKLSKLLIETIDTNIFVNTSRTFTVTGSDQYYNPIDISSNDVKWSADGISGKFVGNTFYPSSTGKAKIYAAIGDVKASIDVTVLDTPYELILNKTTFSITNNPQWLNIEGIDKNGFKAFISSNDVSIDTKGIANITDNYLRSLNEKSGIVKVSFGNIYTYFCISSPSQILDDFENNKDSFWGYPDTVNGSYSLSSEVKKSGNYSGKLSFDFSKAEGTKGAYIKLGSNGYNLDKKPDKLSLWGYTPTQYPYSLKLEIADRNGEVKRLTFANSLNWTGWKENIINFDDNTVFPITIRKIYIVDTEDNKLAGAVYFDRLQAIYNNNSTIKLPASKKIADAQNKPSTLKNNDSFKIAVFGDINTGGTSILNRITSSSKKSSVSAFLGDIPVDMPNDTYIKTNNYNVYDYKNSKIISLSAKGDKNSIRIKDYNQWTNLFKELKNNAKDNLIITLDCSFDDFYDKYEAALFKDTLSDFVKEHRNNIWVVYPAKITTIKNENGIKYIGLKETSSSSLSKKYLDITVNGKDLTYQIKNIGL